MAQTRTLLLVRHAEAAMARSATDHDRPLTERGRAQARHLGHLLGALAPIDHVLVSSALRTRQTLDGLREAGARVAAVEVRDDLYEASVLDILEAVHSVPVEAATVLVIGHAPGLPGLVTDLVTDGCGADDDRARLARGYPPATLTRLAVDRPWDELDAGQADLLEVSRTQI